jgi:hypothetical protein
MFFRRCNSTKKLEIVILVYLENELFLMVLFLLNLFILCYENIIVGTSRGIGYELALQFANASSSISHSKKNTKEIT